MVASRVHGLVTAKDCRIVWTNGRLYVVRTTTDIVSFSCDAPKKHGGTYKAVVGASAITMQPPGCGSCRRRVLASPIGQMSVAQIVAAVESVDA